MSGFVFLLSWYLISCIEIAKILAFCFFDFTKWTNSAPSMRARLRGLLLAYSILGFLFAFSFSFPFCFGFRGMVLSWFFCGVLLLSEVLIILLTLYVLRKKYGNSSGSFNCCFTTVICLPACGSLACSFSARGFACGSSTCRFSMRFLAFSLQSSMQLSIGFCLKLSSMWF